MDFELSDDQLAVQQVAEAALRRHGDPEQLAVTEAGEERFDRLAWRDLADAGVLGLAVSAEFGGAGLGFAETVPALVEQGRSVCLVPLWEAAVLAPLVLARYGTAKQRTHWLPRIVNGSAVLTLGLEESDAGWPFTPPVAFPGTDGEWLLQGTVPAVPYGHVADAVLVPARVPDGRRQLFLVSRDQGGVSGESYERTDRGRSLDLVLDRAPAQRLDSGPADDQLSWLLPRAWVGLAGLQLGVSQESVRRTAAYISAREQFGVPIATFQAAAHQAADCHIDTQAMEVTFWNAVWRLETGRPSTAAAHVARWWSADAGDRVARVVQHLHGGIGSDVTYPIHRYMLWSSQLANTLGSASWHLAQIGAHIAGGTA